MQKVGIYLIFLVIGAIIGASIVTYVTMNQNPNITEQVKVTIQGIEYTVTDHSVLEIELLNDVPEKNLEGNVTVYQDEKQWTSDVTWYYTGYGEAEIICDSINETQKFRITYIEKNPKTTYLDRIIEWKEVSQTYTFMETEQMTFTKVTYTGTSGAADNTIVINLQNTGTADMVLTEAVITGYLVDETCDFTDVTISKGASGTVTLTAVGWTSGSPYNIELHSSKGNKFSYTCTA